MTKRVTPAEGRVLGRKYGVPFVGASSLEGTGVDEAFGLLAEAMFDARELKKPKRKAAPPAPVPALGHTAVGGALDSKPHGSWLGALARCCAACLQPPSACCAPTPPVAARAKAAAAARRPLAGETSRRAAATLL